MAMRVACGGRCPHAMSLLPGPFPPAARQGCLIAPWSSVPLLCSFCVACMRSQAGALFGRAVGHPTCGDAVACGGGGRQQPYSGAWPAGPRNGFTRTHFKSNTSPEVFKTYLRHVRPLLQQGSSLNASPVVHTLELKCSRLLGLQAAPTRCGCHTRLYAHSSPAPRSAPCPLPPCPLTADDTRCVHTTASMPGMHVDKPQARLCGNWR